MRYDELILLNKKHLVESLVSSGAQKAIKETGQGGEGRQNYSRRRMGRVTEITCFHTFRRHYGTI